MRLALRILRPHSLTLTLTLSLSHCLTVSLISLISLISFSSLSSLSLSLSLLSVSRLSVSLLSLLSQEDPGKEPHIKDSSPLPPKRAPCFFLPRCPPLSHSGALAFAPPLASSLYIFRQTCCRANKKTGAAYALYIYIFHCDSLWDSKGCIQVMGSTTFVLPPHEAGDCGVKPRAFPPPFEQTHHSHLSRAQHTATYNKVTSHALLQLPRATARRRMAKNPRHPCGHVELH